MSNRLSGRRRVRGTIDGDETRRGASQGRHFGVVRRWTLGALVALALVGSNSARADDFQVTVYTYYEQQFPDICSDAAGNFVVVWQSYYQDDSGWGIFGRRFGNDFSPAGAEFQVNIDTLGDQGSYYGGPAVACDSSLGFVVVWPSREPDYAVWGRKFDNLGIPAGTAFVVNTYADNNYPGYNNVDVAMDGDGDFVVVWDSYYQDGSQLGVFGQRFGSNGSAVGTEFQVNSYTYYDQGGRSRYADIKAAMDPTGRFVVVWGSYYQDGDDWGVRARQFNSAGVPSGPDFQVTTHTYDYQGQSIAVAQDATGKFVIVWSSYSNYQDGWGSGVFGQRFSALGSKSGAEFQVNTHTLYDQGGYGQYINGVGVAYEPGGDFMVAWASYLQDDYDWGVFAQRYASSGAASGAEFQVNRYTYYRQDHPNVAGHGPDDFVVTWQSYNQDYDRFGVFVNGPDGPTSTPTVTPTPMAGCAATPVSGCATPGKGKLLIKDKDPVGASAKDKVIYKWLKGPQVDQSDFGDPVSGTDIFICIYDNTGLVADFEAPGGSLCAGDPCWKALGTKGYSYKDASTGSDGLQKVLLKGGDAGKSKIIVKAKDGSVDMPGLPLSDLPNVTVQVQRSGGSDCWQTVLPGGPGGTNEAGSFKDQIP